MSDTNSARSAGAPFPGFAGTSPGGGREVSFLSPSWGEYGRRPGGGRGGSPPWLGALALALATHASAQVLEIGEGGQVTVYDRPAVFDASGATPIRPSQAPTPLRKTVRAGVQPALADAALAVQLSPALVEAVAWKESRLRPGVVSRAGAIGEMQLMPRTARALGVDPYDTRQNFQGGAAYLRAMLSRYDGDLIRALAAYNAGPGAVDRSGGVPPFKETRDYVAAIMARLSQGAAPIVQADLRR